VREIKSSVEVLVARRPHGRNTYNSYIIVPANSSYEKHDRSAREEIWFTDRYQIQVHSILHTDSALS